MSEFETRTVDVFLNQELDLRALLELLANRIRLLDVEEVEEQAHSLGDAFRALKDGVNTECSELVPVLGIEVI